MAHSTLTDLFAFTLGPSGWAVLLVTLIVISIPVSLHLYWFNSRSSTTLPSFLLTGPSGAGKTSLLTLFETGTPSQTQTSQIPLSVECSLPVTTAAASNQYRSVNDPGAKYHRNFLLIDTPGHGKLRHYALDNVVNPQHLKGIVFVVDAATISPDSTDNSAGTLSEAATYLHDILLVLQKRSTGAKSSVVDIPVLIAANKMDLFTALPAKLVRLALESEISKLRDTRSKGLLDSGIDMDNDEDRDVLGSAGEGKFTFSLLEEYNIPVEVLGGSVVGSGAAADVQQWWEWMGRHL